LERIDWTKNELVHFATNQDTISFPIEERIFSYDWMDTGDGATPLLAIGAGTKVHLYAHLTTVIYQPRYELPSPLTNTLEVQATQRANPRVDGYWPPKRTIHCVDVGVSSRMCHVALWPCG
jgi:hypothetical protein